jgi:hypothetical protein
MWVCLDADWHTLEVLKLQMSQLNKEENKSYNRENKIKLIFYKFTKLDIFCSRKGSQPTFKTFRSSPNLRVQLACFRQFGRNVEKTLFPQDTEQI